MKTVHFKGLLGNEEIKRYFAAHIENGTCSHAYILEGQPGSGRKTVADAVISALACTAQNVPCGDCENCRKIKEKMCADVFYIRREAGKASLGVAAVRALYDTIYFLPNDLSFKAYVFEDADSMTPQAQNAFLKLLEEPPQNVYFFLIASDRRRFLPTILSRAILLKTERLDTETVAACLEREKALSKEQAARLARLSDGAIGRGLQMATDGEDDAIGHAVSLAQFLFSRGRGDGFEFHLYHTKNIKSSEQLGQVYFYLAMLLRDLMFAKRYEDRPLLLLEPGQAEEMAIGAGDAALMRLYETIAELLSRRDVPTNFSLTLTEFSASLWDARFGKVS